MANICVLLVGSFSDCAKYASLNLPPTVVARKPSLQYDPEAELTLFATALLKASVPYIRQHVRFVFPTLPKLTLVALISLSSTAISRLMLNLRDPFLRNPQVIPKQVTPEAGPPEVMEIVRARGDLEAGTSSEPKNSRAVDIAEAIKSFRLAAARTSPVKFEQHEHPLPNQIKQPH